MKTTSVSSTQLRAIRKSDRPSSRPYVRSEEKSDYDYAQVGFRVYGSHAKLIARGAEKAGKSIADYLRDIVLPMVALDVGMPCPEYASLSGAIDLVAQAASRAGLSVREYERRVAREQAAKELRSYAPQRHETYIAELGRGMSR